MKIPKTRTDTTTSKEKTNAKKKKKTKKTKDSKYDMRNTELKVKQTLIKEDMKQDHPNRHGKNRNHTLDSSWITFETFNHQDTSYL